MCLFRPAWACAVRFNPESFRGMGLHSENDRPKARLVWAQGRPFATGATDKQAHDQVGRNGAGNSEK
jgi:hypothetical protein